MKYWLMKSEPTSYSIDDLVRDKKAQWTGVRNYQARNFMREMQVEDRVLFYHSNADEKGVVGVAKVSRVAHADATALDKKDDHFDPKSTKDAPIWEAVDIAFVEKFSRIVTLDQIKKSHALQGILVAARGSRLSVQPVSKAHFEEICRIASISPLKVRGD